MVWPRNALNTAAASVEATTAPINNVELVGRSKASAAPPAAIAAVMATPMVARMAAGNPARRIACGAVASPPSNKMTISATIATFWASRASSKWTSASPSSATAIPSTRKSTSPGNR